MTNFILFAATFCQVSLKAFQQLNVMKSKYWWVVPTSFGMAAAEIYIIVSVAHTGVLLPSILSMGLGGGIGCVFAMYLHGRLSNVSR